MLPGVFSCHWYKHSGTIRKVSASFRHRIQDDAEGGGAFVELEKEKLCGSDGSGADSEPGCRGVQWI